MFIYRCSLYGVFIIFVLIFDTSFCQDGTFFLKASRNVPRIGKRSKNNNDESFEKFFLKASKSVPRIGRRGEPPASIGLPYPYLQEQKIKEKNVKYPVWADLADLYEYNPELFSSPQLLAQLDDGMMGDDPNAYDWDRIRLKRTNFPNNLKDWQNKELIEYRLQPEIE